MTTATTEKDTKLKSQVKVEDLGPCSKKLKFEVPADEVSKQLGTSVDAMVAEAELPGFRKGRAPKRLIEKRFGDSLRKDAKQAIVATAYQQAVEEHQLRIVGDPIGNEDLAKVEIEDGKALKFEIDVETMPTFELPKLDGIEVKRPVMDVTEEILNKEIERLLLNEGSLQEKAAPESGDYLTGHAIMKDDTGHEHLNINDAVIQIPTADKGGKGMILGVMVEDFAKQLGKPTIGQTLTITTVGPENHETEALRGKNLVISFEVKRADQIIPATIDEVAQRYGMEKADDVRDAIRQRIEQKMKVEQQSLMRQQVAKHLMESIQFDLPKRVTAVQAQRNLDRARFDLMHRGWDQARIEEHMAELRSASGGQAVGELKLFFILDKVAEELKVQVNEAELNSRIAQIAFSRGDRPERLRQEIIQRNQAGALVMQIREQKTLDAILAKADVKDVSVEEFNKMLASQAGSTTGASASAKPAAEKKKPAAKKEEVEEEAKPKAAKPKKKA